MSHLPKYTREADEEHGESVQLLKGDNRSSLDLEAQVPAYPPRLGESSTSPGDEPKSTVTYTFLPRWPIQGDRQDAIGIMGRTKAEAIAIVRGGFPLLATFPEDRVEFLAPIAINAEGVVVDDRWGIVMDEAWPAFVKTPPSRLMVQIQDLPGDAEARSQHEGKVILTVIGCLIAFGASVLLIIWLCGGFTPVPPALPVGKA